MILAPGLFNVADYRKAIPAHVKLQVLLNHVRARLDALGWNACCEMAHEVLPAHDASQLEFDHDPALTNRPYDTLTGDFIPPQNDPNHIVARDKQTHLQKTTGRVAGAARTVTTRGSDVGERARTSDIRAADAVHRARLAAKAGRQGEADEILASARFKKKHVRPKQKIAKANRPWPKRKMRSAR